MKTKPFYISTFFRSLAESLISPFIPIFALSLGATKALIGLTSTMPNFASLISQLFGGSLSESMKRKSMLIILSGIAWALMWIPIAMVKDTAQLVILLTVQSLLSSISVPAWTVLLLQAMPSYKRAYITGDLSVIDSIASFIGTLVGGFILNSFGFLPFLFYIILFLGVISRIPFFSAKEQKTSFYDDKSLKNFLKRTFDFSVIKREKELVKLIIAITFLNFSVNLAAPFLSVYVVTQMNGNLMNIAVISAIGILSAIVFFRPWGSVIDKSRKKLIMFACIIPISFIPFVYAIANDMNWLYVYSAVSNMSWAGFNLAAFAYLADVLPKDRTSSSIGIYNLFVGLGAATGPLIGGLLADSLGMQQVFFLSTFLRLSTVFLLYGLEEKEVFRPRNIFRFGSDTIHGLENFINTYSLVVNETIRQGIGLTKIKRHLRRKH